MDRLDQLLAQAEGQHAFDPAKYQNYLLSIQEQALISDRRLDFKITKMIASGEIEEMKAANEIISEYLPNNHRPDKQFIEFIKTHGK